MGPVFYETRQRLKPAEHTEKPAEGLVFLNKKPDFNLVELQGLEPWTSSMPWKRSSQLSYSPVKFRLIVNLLVVAKYALPQGSIKTNRVYQFRTKKTTP